MRAGPREALFGAVALLIAGGYVWVASLTAPISAPPSSSAVPPTPTRPAEQTGVPRVPGAIAFVLGGDVYVLRDGRYAPLTSEGRSLDPDLSRDGADLFFARREEIDGARVFDGVVVSARLGFTRIVRKPAAGGAEDVILDGLRRESPSGQHEVSWYLEPAISPDGKRLAVVEDDGGGAADLEVVTLGTRRSVVILSQGAQLADPAWSPDGGTVAVTSYNTDTPGILLWPLGAAGAAERLEGLPEGDAYRPSFSPDGDWIVYTLRHEGRNDVHAFDLDTERDVALTSDGKSWNGVLSPDGSWLAFLREKDGKIDVYAMELAAVLTGGAGPKEAIQLTRGEGIDGASRLSWSR